MKKSWILLVLLALSVAVLTGCTSNADTMPSPSPSASPLASLTPAATTSIMPVPAVTPTVQAGITTLEDATRISTAIKKEVEKLSELTSADVVASGNMALVGIQYDTQYQGGLTDRLKQMVQARVEASDKAITVIHVTDDTKLVQEIQKLAQQMQKSEITFAELQTRMLELSAQIAGPSMGTGTGTTTAQPQATSAV